MTDAAPNVDKEEKQLPTAEKIQKKRGRPSLAQQIARQRSNSTGTVSDLFKRKRQEQTEKEEEQNNIEKIRRVHISPLEKGKEKEGGMGQEQYKNIMKVLQEMQTELKEIPKLRLEINEWKEGIIKKDEKIKGLEEKIQILERKEEARERKEKRNSNVIKGWDVSKSETLKDAVSELLKKELRVEGKVIEAKWSGKKHGNGRTGKLGNEKRGND